MTSNSARDGDRERSQNHSSNSGYEVNTMRLINSNPGTLMTNPEREMGRMAQNPEAASVVMRNIKRQTGPRQ